MKKERKPIKRKLTKERIVKAIQGSGGLVSIIAKRLGSSYTTITQRLNLEGWEDVREELRIEREVVGDLAEQTIQDVMKQRLDLGTAARTARWYLERRFSERGYHPKKVVIEGGENPLLINSNTQISLETLKLPIDVRKMILKALETSTGVENTFG